MTLIFERSATGRRAAAQAPQELPEVSDIPLHLRRKHPPLLPEVGELQVVRHYTQLSRKNFSIDTHMYPLGSCTMKYNPRGAHQAAMLPGFLARHPLAPLSHSQGVLSCFYELQEILKEVTGMQGVSLTPAAGAQGEFAGVAMIRAYHHSRGDDARQEMLVPAAAHGTNPATAVMCGYRVREVAVLANGDVDIDNLKAALGPQTAGLMMTNPSTLGVFERQIAEIAQAVHAAGGLLYYDGANLNAILGKVRPGDMGFDVLHMNLHKTFATPHGGGGPGAGPVAVAARLAPFLPGPKAARVGEGFAWRTPAQSIGRVHGWHGNALVLARALAYIEVHGGDGLRRVAERAVLNARYLQRRLADTLPAAYDGPCMHECVLTAKGLKDETGVRGLDVAKALLEHGFHAPTVYFPLIVEEALMFEPTETESRETIDALVDALTDIARTSHEDPEEVREAPRSTPVRRLDEARAARHLVSTEDAATR